MGNNWPSKLDNTSDGFEHLTSTFYVIGFEAFMTNF